MLQSDSIVNKIKILNSKKIKTFQFKLQYLKMYTENLCKVMKFLETNTTWPLGLAKTMECAQDYTAQTKFLSY